ncbi:MAG: choice-of-anchor J domain-containing protein [Paludibacteraceae bacterium]|nr:choice-of-anchor J domain-containing protein [Paludibacteraceae bacterium]
MRKKLLVMSVLAMLFCLNMNVSAQLSILTENFESGMPTGWTVDPASATTPWTVSSSGLTGVTAYGGTNYLSLYTTDQQSATKLVLPLMDASSLTQPEMRFYLMQKARGQNTGYARDTLKVYARNSVTANWVLVATKSAELSVWTLQTVDLSQFAGGSLQIAFEYVYGAGLGIGIDNLFVGDPAVCYTPNNLRAYRITHNTAELMWNAYETAFQYGLKVSTTPLAAPATTTANVLDQTVMYKPFTVTGLTPSTSYYFYVSADCGNGDESAWSPAGQFTTGCLPVNTPYNQGFETTGDFNTCWTREFVASGSWSSTPSANTYQPKASTSYHHAGSSCAQLYGYYNVSGQDIRTTQAWIASPEINVADISTQQVIFWAYTSAIDCELRVGVMSDPSDPASFEEVTTVTPSVASQWQEFTVPLNSVTSTNAVYVAFMVDGSDFNKSFNYYIDDVVIETTPLCPKATIVKAENIGGTNATITWLGTSTVWNIKVSTTALSDPQTQTANILDSVVGASPFQLTGLTPKTTYYVYLQPDCSAAGNGTGVWSDEIHFTTTQIPATVPYLCDFEGDDANQWDLINGTQSNKWVVGTATHNGTGTHALYVSNNNGTSFAYNNGSTSYTYALRTLSLNPGIFEIHFDWTAKGENNWDCLRAFLLPSNVIPEAGNAYGMTGSTNTTPQGWIDLGNGQLNQQDNWQHISYLLTVNTPTTYNLVFFWKNDGTSGNNPPGAIDNIQITEYTCAPPTNITFSNVTQNGFIAFWTPSVLNENQWEAQLVLGSTVLVDTVVSTPMVNFNGLSASTSYQVRVRSVCGANDFSSWASAGTTTACGDITALPYSDDFENAAYGSGTGSFPTCWYKAQSYSTSYPYCSTSYNHTTGGTKSLYFYYSSSSPANYVVLPRLNVPGVTLQQLQMDLSLLYSSSTVYRLTVGVMDHPDSINSFVPVATLSSAGQTNTWAEHSVNFASYTGNGQYIAFTDAYSTSSYNYIYLDDVVIDLAPSCAKPTGFAASNISESSVSLNWDAMPGATFQVVLTTGNGSLANPVDSKIVSTNSTSFTGLSGLTTYDAYIRAICGAGDTSVWANAVTFTTFAVPEVLPLYTDFSNAADNAKWQLENGSQSNKWFVGNATGNGDSHALYISNNATGATAGYNTSSTSYVYAYRLLKFTPGIYDISFDWRAGGESTYDMLRAFLVPANETFTAGNSGKLSSNTVVPAGWISLNNTTGYFNNTSSPSSWQNQSASVTFTDTTNMYLLFYWKNDNYGGTQPGACVDNVSVSALTCASNVSISKGDTYAVFNFTPSQSTPTGYEIVVNNTAINLNNLNNVLYHSTISGNSDTVTGLTAKTQYYAYTRAICGNDTGRWAASNFKTECAFITVPYTWDFEESSSNSIPECWTRPTGATTSYPYVYNSSTNARSGSKYLYFYGSPYNTDPTVLASPLIPVDDIRDYRLTFYTRYSSVGSKIAVGVMSDPTDLSTLVGVDTVEVTQSNQWEEQVVRFRNYNGNGKYFAFFIDNGMVNGSNNINLDDVTISEDRLCMTPDNLSVSQITGNGAYLIWSGNNAVSFDMLMTTEAVNPDTITGTEAAVFLYEEDLYDPFLDLSGYLDVNQTYWVYIKADCNAADGRPSLWSEPVIFTTSCTAQPLPYATTFDIPRLNIEGNMPACWVTMHENVGTMPTGSYTLDGMSQNTTYYSGNPAHTDHAALRLYGYYSSTASTKSFAALPEFSTPVANYTLSFMVNQSSTTDGVMLVGTMSDASDASTFTPFDTIHVSNSWKRYDVSLANLQMSSSDRLAICVDGDLNQRTVTFYVDELEIAPSVACQAPSNFYVSNYQSAMPDFTLNTLHAADSLVNIQITSQNVAMAQLDSLAAAGAVTFVLDTVVNVGSLPLHVPFGVLSGKTQYHAYARVVCDAANNQYSARTSVDFTTGCAAVLLPYVYGFEDATGSTTSSKPTCWAAFQTNGSTTYPYTYNYYHKTGNYSLYFYGSSLYTTYGVLPEIYVDSISKVMVTFSILYSNTTNRIELGVMDDPNDASTFTSIGFYNVQTANQWSTYNVPLSAYTGNGKYIAFRTATTTTGSTSCTMYLDDVEVELVPTCFRPTGSTLDAITETSATISWTAGQSGETNWEYVLVPQGQAANSGTPVATTTNTATVSGLTASTDYDFYVRAVCSATDHSEWSNVLSIRTMNHAQEVPMSTDFSDHADNALWTLANGSQTNKWYINNNLGNNGAGALFVSNNGTSNTYNNSSASVVYAYRTFKFAPDTYTIEFDWVANGEGSYDLLRPFLTTATPEAGNAYGMTGSTNTIPAGWTSLSGTSWLNQQSSWQHFSTTLTVTDTTVYNLVFLWKNDDYEGTNPSAAIDNLHILGSYCSIQSMTATATSENEITISSVTSDATHFNIYVSDSVMTPLDLQTATPTAVADSFPVVISGLNANTTYYVYAQGTCGTSDLTNVISTSTKTYCDAVTVNDSVSYTENFDSYGTSNYAKPDCWTTGTTSTTAYPYVSTTHHSGVGSLYFSCSSSYYSYAATPRITGTPINNLRMEFWGYKGSNAYSLEVGVMTDPTDYTTFQTIATVSPSSTYTWQQFTVDFNTYTGAGQYVAFRQPVGSSQTFYLDDVTITTIPSCAEPALVFSPMLGTDSIMVNIVPAHAEDTQWQVVVTPASTTATPDLTTALYDTIVNTTAINFGGFAPTTQYTVYGRTICSASQESSWRKVNVTTPCASVTITPNVPFTEDFSSYANNAYVTCWTTKQLTTAYGVPYVVTAQSATTPNSLRFNGGNTYITTPVFTNDLNTLRVNFKLRQEHATNSGVIRVGVMSDPNDYSTFELVQTITCQALNTWEDYTVNFANTQLAGGNRVIAFEQLTPNGNGYWFWMDDVRVEIIPDCEAPNVTLDVNQTQLNVNIAQATTTTMPIEVIVTTGNTPDATGASLDTVTTASSLSVAVVPGYTYHVFARSLCDSVSQSPWATSSILIPNPGEGLPLSCDFEDVNDYSNWQFASNDNGSSRWCFGTDTAAVKDGTRSIYISNSASVYTYESQGAISLAYRRLHIDQGTYQVMYDWKCEGDASYDYMRIFLVPTTTDIQTITTWYGTTYVPTGCIALDGNYRLNQHGNVWQHYSGNQTIATGDYYLVLYWHEDNYGFNDPPAAVDNLFLGTLKYATITDSVCDGYNYQGNGFNIPSTDITLGGTNSFQRLQNDTMLTLNLTVIQSSETVFNEVICPGATYTQNGFNTSVPGTYHRYLTAASGCDSVVTLNLSLNSGYLDEQTVAICQNQTPYLWHGQSLTTSGQYTHTSATAGECDSVYILNLTVSQSISIDLYESICQGTFYQFNGHSYGLAGDYTWTGTAAGGCDSTVTLHLTVNPVYYQTVNLTIFDYETPYEWNGFSVDTTGSYTWYGQTAAGCDSVVTLDLYVRCVGLDYAEDGMFAISPNPVHRGGNVRLDVSLNEAERDGMVVEVFTSNGKLVNRFEPKEQPMFIKMPDIDGLYMVRLTTGTGRVLYGKVIVK